MRAVFVAHTHPATPHVAAQRFSRFADAMARRGHQILLLTEARDSHPVTQSDTLALTLEQHDWDLPLHVACRPKVTREGSKQTKWPAPVRRLRAGLALLGRGHNPSWVASAQPYLPILAAFKPDVVWGVFGSVSDLVVARSVAHMTKCAYVIDFKDSWTHFIPAPLRHIVAFRFQDAAGLTANAQFHADAASRCFPRHRIQVVYSGVAPEFMATSYPQASRHFSIVVLGSLYGVRSIRTFLSGVKAWREKGGLGTATQAELIYAGTDHEQFQRVIEETACPLPAKVFPHLPIGELAELCRSATVNAYIRSERTFHHKLLELVACNRPIIAVPDEGDEAKALAARLGGFLISCSDAEAVSQALSEVQARETTAAPPDSQVLDITWDSFASGLEHALLAASTSQQP
jgi:glycosyltransferase involved in cell wall biosynthesis